MKTRTETALVVLTSVVVGLIAGVVICRQLHSDAKLPTELQPGELQVNVPVDRNRADHFWEKTDWMTWVVTAAAAASVVWFEVRRSRRSRQVEIIMDFDKQFNAPEMIQIRKKAAQSIRACREQKASPDDSRWTDVEDVIDFFQGMGTFVRDGHADVKVAYKFFGYWVIRYRVACKQRIDFQQRDAGLLVWADFEWLFKQFKKVDRKLNEGRHVAAGNESLDAFLEGESLEEERRKESNIPSKERT